jgi:flagellar protein FliO/FliZ
LHIASSCLFRRVFILLLLLAPLAAGIAQQSAPAAPEAAAPKASAAGSSSQVSEESLIIPGGDKPEAAASPAPSGPLVSAWDFLRMLLILAAVVGVIYLLFFLLKRGFRRQLPQNDLIRVLGSRSLSGNRSLHLVAMGRSVFLVGSAEGGISLIAEVKDPETLDQLRLESAEAARLPQGFAGLLQSLWKGGAGRTQSGDSLEFMKQQRQRLQKM